jgi:HlyD family secretion protein
VNSAPLLETQRATAISAASAPNGVVLNATGYIVAAHKIELAAKVVGKVKWIGVDKGDHVQEGQVLVRLEDDEYQANVQPARGQLISLASQARRGDARLASRGDRAGVSQPEIRQGRPRERPLESRPRAQPVRESLGSQQSLDDAQGRYDSAVHRVNSLEKTYELARIGPRQEEIDSLCGQVEQAKGALAYANNNLDNTVIRAPLTGTILEREVEKG